MGALFDTVYVSVYKYFNAPFGGILIKGSSTPGKLADFVVLSDDPFKVDKREDQGHPDRSHAGGRRHSLPSVDFAARRCRRPIATVVDWFSTRNRSEETRLTRRRGDVERSG